MNPSTAFGTVFADELVRCGLREAVLAPGSRSAPLALALYDLAGGPGPARRRETGGRPPEPALRLHVRIDERSAGFLALGLAKASGRPAAVICTSGTAAAHLHAAVIEADEAGVPLLVLTADRPPELRGTGANQTIDQLKLYGSAVRWFCEAGVPEARPGMAGYWRSLACRAWALASGAGGGFPGPVHINVPLREPLVPAPGAAGRTGPGDGAGRLAGAARRPAGRSAMDEHRRGRPRSARPARPGPAPGSAALELDAAQRGVIVCGDGAEAAALPGLAELAGLAGAGRAVLGRQARSERALGLPIPAGYAGIRGRAPARADRLGGPAGPLPQPARLPAGRGAGGRPGPACRAGAGPGPLGRSGPDRHRRGQRYPAARDARPRGGPAAR